MAAPYEWSQNDAEVSIKVPLEDAVGKDKVKVKFETSHVPLGNEPEECDFIKASLTLRFSLSDL
eukprot:3202266-Amphidinium_carterae.1